MTKARADVAVLEAAHPGATLAAEKVLGVRVARGGTGGSLVVGALYELAVMEGRSPVMLDAARNPSLSAHYPGIAVRPASAAINDVKEAITTAVLDVMMEQGRSGLIDLGGGQDDTLVDYMLDLDLVAFGRSVGIRPVFLVTFGPSMDDFDHALEVRRRGLFDGASVLLIQNEGVLRRGQDPAQVFGAIQARREFVQWVEEEGARPLYLKALACLDGTASQPGVRSLGLTLRDAAANRANANGVKIGLTKAAMVRGWLDGWRRQFEQHDCEEWRP